MPFLPPVTHVGTSRSWTQGHWVQVRYWVTAANLDHLLTRVVTPSIFDLSVRSMMSRGWKWDCSWWLSEVIDLPLQHELLADDWWNAPFTSSCSVCCTFPTFLARVVIHTRRASLSQLCSHLCRVTSCQLKQLATVVNSTLVVDPTIRLPGFDLHRRQWSLLNRFRTGQGHCNACHKKWGFTDNELCDCMEKPRQCHTSSTLVHWLSLMAVYCAHMKQMRLPSTGWQHMALSTR